MMQEAKVKAIAPWFGGKRTMAPLVVTEIGKHTQYFEPFCGSMAVLFAKQPSQKETVNDLHGDLINLARVLQEGPAAEALYDRLQKVLFSEARIVVSYYDHPRIRELYKGWTFVEHTRQKHLHAQNGRGARPKDALEVLIINGPSYAVAT
jgi:site-specific DNA-adenine methylase